MRVTLRAVADDCHLFALDEGEVGVLVVEDFGHLILFSCFCFGG
jgi:hypothetical protein